MCQLLNKVVPGLLHLQAVSHGHLDVLDELLALHVLCHHHGLSHLHGIRRHLLRQAIQPVQNPTSNRHISIFNSFNIQYFWAKYIRFNPCDAESTFLYEVRCTSNIFHNYLIPVMLVFIESYCWALSYEYPCVRVPAAFHFFSKYFVFSKSSHQQHKD